MYKAVNIQDGQELNLLDSRWEQGIEALRALDQHDLLVCQGCKQAVRVRAGEIRRWHFAHKELLTCAYGRESPALLQARAVLYAWLVTKFGDKVTVEKQVDDPAFSRPVDCWVEGTTGVIAYWIVEAAAPPPTRAALREGFRRLGVVVKWVFLAPLLHVDEERPTWVHLTTTEREFMHHSVYDDLVNPGLPDGHSLHYLDVEQRMLTTLRGLHLVHPPHVFAGQQQHHTLAVIQVAPKTGEFVHPGEYDRLKRYHQAQAQVEKRRREAAEARTHSCEQLRATATEQQCAEEGWPLLSTVTAPAPHTQSPGEARAPEPTQDRAGGNAGAAGWAVQAEAECVFCGVLTSEWWYFDPLTNQCKCRACYRQGKY
jgi:hypothetical protein